MKQSESLLLNHRRTAPPLAIWLIVFSFLLLAPIAGLLSATGSVFLVIIPVVMLLTVVLAFYPWHFTWLLLFCGIVVLGVVRLYAPQFQNIRWLIPPLAIGVPIALLILQAFKPGQVTQARQPALLWWVVAFVTAALMTTLINWSGLATSIVGLKSYFQVWGLIAVFALIHSQGDFSRGLTKLLIAIALLQIPFVLHQYLFLVPIRSSATGLSPEDVIAGTFGAELYGGGNNAVLTAFLFIAVGILLSLWRQKILASALVFPGVLLLIFPVFLNEAKVAFFYAWVMFLVLYWDDIVRRPARFILGNIVLLLFLFVFVSFYAHIAAESGKVHDLGQYLEFLKEQNFDRGYGAFALNRWTALTFWFQEHFPRDIWHALIGHGLGETQEGALLLDVSNTIAARRYHGMGIGLTGLSALLWDVGLIGLALVAVLFISTYRLAGRLAQATCERPQAVALFKGLQSGVAILALSIVHKSFFVFDMAFQSLFVLIVGYLIYSARHLRHFSMPHSACNGQPVNG
ncbi:MAG: hypothetical protein PHR30_00455 [Gallionellaceae bacterium]|nr:hypothetical protein [Gallionellaceae bacterium]